ncbi:nucleotidyltransferase family protein [Lentilitoribacter sp. Alg239-R112]|uniref:nucleotidyltransferase family protein n=1 Tax=Lentilitoribacter sp. Alg239-R112 TaxID=2305987 RepID=UPI0031B72B41
MKTAMILAAGLGNRMRPLTDKTPKPLVEVNGKALLQYSLDAAKEAGIESLVINVHHLADQVENYLKNQDNFNVTISDERDELLDSGGGIANALPFISDDEFVLLNADTFWLDDQAENQSNLSALISVFDESRMDILIMCVPISRTTGHTGKGDFKIDSQGKLERYKGVENDPLIHAGVAILHRRIFDGISDKKFSINRCLDTAISHGRLFGHIMHGSWLTVGTVDAIHEAEAAIKRIG